jgi:hypothetical protein
MIVAHVRTPIRMAELPAILDAGYHQAVATCPGPDVVAVAWAHLVLEHGRRKNDDDELLAGVWCNNLGNIDLTWLERSDPSVRWFVTVPECEGPMCRVRAVHRRRAFDSPEEGAAYYWASLQGRFPDAFYAMAYGPEAFVDALRAARYFTGDPAAYRHSVVALVREVLRG